MPTNPEQPQGPTQQREAVKASIQQSLDAMRTQMDARQREVVLGLLRNEQLPTETLLTINQTLEQAQDLYAMNPTAAVQAMNLMIEQITGQGSVNTSEVQARVAQTPESMQKIGGLIEKLSGVMNGLGDQMGQLGSGTLKMLEGFFGPDSFLGKAFGFLKNSPKAQEAFLVKALTEQQKQLAPGTEIPKVIQMMRGQIVQAQNAERLAKRQNLYDIVQHVGDVMAMLGTKATLSLADLEAAGKKAVDAYKAELANQPPEQVAAAASSQESQQRRPVSSQAVETKVSSGDTAVLGLTFDAGKVTIAVGPKKATVTAIEGKNVSKVEVLDATAKAAAAVVFTLNDNSQIKIDAPEFKRASEQATPIKITGHNLTTKTDMSVEVAFA